MSKVDDAIALYSSEYIQDFNSYVSTLNVEQQEKVKTLVEQLEYNRYLNDLELPNLYDEVIYNLERNDQSSNSYLLYLLKKMGKPKEDAPRKKEIIQTINKVRLLILSQSETNDSPTNKKVRPDKAPATIIQDWILEIAKKPKNELNKWEKELVATITIGRKIDKSNLTYAYKKFHDAARAQGLFPLDLRPLYSGVQEEAIKLSGQLEFTDHLCNLNLPSRYDRVVFNLEHNHVPSNSYILSLLNMMNKPKKATDKKKEIKQSLDKLIPRLAFKGEKEDSSPKKLLSAPPKIIIPGETDTQLIKNWLLEIAKLPKSKLNQWEKELVKLNLVKPEGEPNKENLHKAYKKVLHDACYHGYLLNAWSKK